MKSYPISFHFYTIEVFFFENGKKNGGEDEMATVLPIFIKIDYVNCKFSQKRVRKNDKLFYKTDFSIDLFRFLFAKCQKNGRRRCCQSASVAKYGTKNWKHLQSKKKTVPARWLVEIAHPPVTFVVVVVVVVVVVAGRDERPCKWSANGPHIPHRSMNNEWNSPKKQQQQQQKEPINQTKPNQTKHTHTHKKHHPT